MILLGYKSKITTILRALAAIGVGIVLIALPNDGSPLLVRIIASVLFGAGIIALAYAFANRSKMKSSHYSLILVNAIAVAVLGLVLLIWPGLIAGIIVTIVGIVLICFGLLQVVVLGGAMNFLGLGYAGLAFSVVAIIGGIIILISPFTSTVMSVIAGILLVYYGLSELFSMVQVNKAREEYEIRFPEDAQAPAKPVEPASKGSLYGNVKDADYVEVDDQ
ncbi:MAG: DUF308 domain-containing protein [Bacteroidales bacterium]|jgi:uncharacterized membrane protein HdeD (DUF308 family)|nr:DUF308 domain-containing protein [Bacteroidales bacterium]